MFEDVVSTDLADNLTYAAQTIDSRNLFSPAHKTALEAFPYFVLAYANCSVSYRHLTQGAASYIHLHPLCLSWACIHAERMAEDGTTPASSVLVVDRVQDSSVYGVPCRLFSALSFLFPRIVSHARLSSSLSYISLLVVSVHTRLYHRLLMVNLRSYAVCGQKVIRAILDYD